MASRKEQKAQARQAREQAQAAQAAKALKTKRIRLTLGFLLGAIVIIAILIVASSTQSGGDANNVVKPSSLAAINSLPQQNNVLGKQTAPITVTEYGDLQCPICKRASETVIPDIINNDVQQGKVKLVYKPWPILGDDSVKAAAALVAADQQDKGWQFLQTFYANQGPENSGYITNRFLDAIATSVGLDLAQFKRDRQSSQTKVLLAQNNREATQAGFTGTPSFTISNGKQTKQLPLLPTSEELQSAIDSLR